MVAKTVDLYIGADHAPVVVNVAQYDSNWEYHIRILYEEQRWTIPSGCTAFLVGKKPDGHVAVYEGSLNSNELIFTPDEQLTACPGYTRAEVRVLKGGKSIAAPRLVFAVAPVPESEDDVASDTTLAAYAEVLGIAANIPENIPEVITDWLEDHITQGDVIDDSLSVEGAAADAKATGDTIAAETTARAAADTALTSELNDVKSTIGQITGNKPLSWQRGRYKTSSAGGIGDTLTFEDLDVYVYAKQACNAGDQFTIHLYGASGICRGWYFCDENMVCLSRMVVVNMVVTEVITAPEGAAWVILNNRIEYLGTGYYAYTGGTPVSEALKAYAAVGTQTASLVRGSAYHYFWNTQGDVAVKEAYSGSYTAYDPIPVKPGLVIYGTADNPSSGKTSLCALVDDDFRIVTRASSTGGVYKFICPEGATFALFTAGTDSGAAKFTCFAETLNVVGGGNYDFSGKNIAIIGDSISTNGAFSDSNPLGNVPEIVVQDEDVGIQLSAYVTHYDIGTVIGGHEIVAEDVGTELTFTPTADDVGKLIGKPLNNNAASVVTWWEVAMERLGFNPIPVCWSGSSITDHEGAADSYKTSYAFHPAQIRKCGIRTPGSMDRTAPDVVIIYRGTNDFSHSPYTRLNYDLASYHPEGYPTSDTFDDAGTTRYDFISGLLMTIKAVRDAYPSSLIVLCTLNYFKRMSSSWPGFPTRNGQNTLEQYNAAIRSVADYTGCQVIDFAKDGLTAWNASSVYYQETAPNFTHPTSAGHKIMGERALRDLINGLNAK